jgi:hypothetical protein
MVRFSFVKGLNADNNELSFKEELIGLLLYNRFAAFLRRIGRFIKRMCRWIPVLWNQEEWDYAYIYDLLVMKMKELKGDMSKDYWHDQKEVQRSIKQIDLCLERLDRYLNWMEHYYYPMEDIYYEPTEDGCVRMCYASKRNEKQRLGASEFEEKNFRKFWKNFVKWHRGWWT